MNLLPMIWYHFGKCINENNFKENQPLACRKHGGQEEKCQKSLVDKRPPEMLRFLYVCNHDVQL